MKPNCRGPKLAIFSAVRRNRQLWPSKSWLQNYFQTSGRKFTRLSRPFPTAFPLVVCQGNGSSWFKTVESSITSAPWLPGPVHLLAVLLVTTTRWQARWPAPMFRIPAPMLFIREPAALANAACVLSKPQFTSEEGTEIHPYNSLCGNSLYKKILALTYRFTDGAVAKTRQAKSYQPKRCHLASSFIFYKPPKQHEDTNTAPSKQKTAI